MCGIAGIFGMRTEGRVEAMVSAMRHRGPDDFGIFSDGDAVLGMTRLAIIDVTKKGHQPMTNADKSVWIAYNGETYNFRQERRILEEKGHTFFSHSDTEVVLRMYEVYGDDFLLHMRGMFALAIYDKRNGPGRERLLLARDHLGIKPLLYANTGPNFIFASEMKSLLASGLVEPVIDPEALRLLLAMGSVPQPLSIVTGVKMLLPGHRLIIEGRRERMERYWKLETGRIKGIAGAAYEDLVSEVRSALEESVRLQMVSDVPLGAFLSSGVDSTLLVALMAKNSDHRIKTFSVGFGSEGAGIDETDDAARTASFIGTDHTKVIVTGNEVREKIIQIASALDQPTVDGVNSYFVSKAARTRVTVAISGTGGDELFAGYPWFSTMTNAVNREKEHPYLAAAQKLSSSFFMLPVFERIAGGRFGAAIDMLRAGSGFLQQYSRQYRIFDVSSAARTLSPHMRRAARIGRETALDMAAADELPHAGPLERVSALCLRGYTQNQLLRDIDAVSMSHSLEVRVPFLDPVLADLALSLPHDAKMGRSSGLRNAARATYRETGSKRILLEAGRGLLPEGLDLQPKRGFGMPFETWLKTSLKDVFEDTLAESTVRARGIFAEHTASDIRGQFLSGRIGWSRPWLLMMTELWCREVIDPLPAPTESGNAA